MSTITLTAEQVKAEAYKEYNPDTNDFHFLPDGTCVVVPLKWHDEASYNEYQYGCGQD